MELDVGIPTAKRLGGEDSSVDVDIVSSSSASQSTENTDGGYSEELREAVVETEKVDDGCRTITVWTVWRREVRLAFVAAVLLRFRLANFTCACRIGKVKVARLKI